jgi:hypothetical protein
MTCAVYAVLASMFGMAIGGVIGVIVGIKWAQQHYGV